MTDPPVDPPDRTDASDRNDATESDSEAGAPGRPGPGSDEEIDEAGDESFPASDAPQWWSGESDDDT